MSIHSALRSWLLADATIAAEVGTRILPPKSPQAAIYPLIRLWRVSGQRVGNLRTPASLARPRVQVDVFTAESSGTTAFTAAERLGRLVRQRLELLRNETLVIDDSVSPAVSTRVQLTFEDEAGPEYENDVTGGYWHHRSEYFVAYGTVGGAY